MTRLNAAIRVALAVTAIAAPALHAATCSPTLFVEAPEYPVGQNPESLVIADFNGDAFLDVATVNWSSLSVSVLLNLGDGTFAPEIETDVSNSPNALAAADFDGNGDMDLAVGTYGQFRILFGNGDGTFGAPVDYAVATNQISGIQAVSLDAGASPDLILSSEGGSSLWIALNDGSGVFGPRTPFPAGGATRHFTVGDFDGSGALDAVAANYESNTVSLLLGAGDGTFAPPLSFIAGSGPTYVVSGDFDGDGDLDVATSTADYVSVLKGNGGGAFGASLQYPAENAGPLAVSDFTEDGVLDLAVLNRYDFYYSGGDRISILPGNGSGGFAPAASSYRPGDDTPALRAGDLNADGRPDIAASSRSEDAVVVLLATGGGEFAGARSVATPVSAYELADGDYNQDAIPDLAIGGQGRVAVLLGDGRGGFAVSATYAIEGETRLVISGDFDNDQILDLFALSYYWESFFLRGNGDGTFDLPAPVAATGIRAAADDLDADGNLDLVVTRDCCEIIDAYLGRGDGTFEPAIPTEVGSQPSGVALARLDDDPFSDVALSTPGTNEVRILIGQGDGSFAAPAAYPVGADPQSVAAVDLTGDGVLDLVVANRASQNLTVLPGNGDGTFGAGSTIGLGLPVVFVAAGDLDGDGLADLVTANYDHGSVSVFPGYGAGKFGSPVTYGTDRNAQFVVVRDFDLNGYPDLAVATPEERSITVLLNSILGVGSLPAAGACEGGAGILHAFAAGFGPLTYEWRKDGVPLADGGNVSGATTATLTIDPATAADEGSYDVVVSDLCTTVTSDATPFSVTSPPTTPVIGIDSQPAPGVAGTASVPDSPGNTYAWTLGGDAEAVITSGQGTSQITFLAQIPGAVTLEVVAYSSPGCGAPSGTTDVVVDFFDVPPAHPFHTDIVTVARERIAAGCGSGNYCPGEAVTRAQMAVFLLKGLNGADWIPQQLGAYFADVPPGSFAYDWINNLASMGVTTGCGLGNYCPDSSVTRAQMAVFLLKTLGIFSPPPAVGIFGDVPVGAFAADFIEDLHGRGITGGCSTSPLLYCPDSPVNRGQMAVFLVRTFLTPAP